MIIILIAYCIKNQCHLYTQVKNLAYEADKAAVLCALQPNGQRNGKNVLRSFQNLFILSMFQR